MVDVFDEVEEELRKERYMQMLRSWGPWVLGAAVTVVVGVAGYQGWQAWQDSVAAEASAEFVAARALEDAGDTEGAQAAYEAMVAEGPRGYATLALLHQAALARESGDNERAAQLYEQAGQRSPVELIRDLARYQAAVAGFDGLSSDDLAVRLDPLVSGGGGFSLLSRELIGAAALRDERWEEARTQYQFIQLSLDASQAMRERARDALSVILANAPAEVVEEDVVAEDLPEAADEQSQETPAPADEPSEAAAETVADEEEAGE